MGEKQLHNHGTETGQQLEELRKSSQSTSQAAARTEASKVLMDIRNEEGKRLAKLEHDFQKVNQGFGDLVTTIPALRETTDKKIERVDIPPLLRPLQESMEKLTSVQGEMQSGLAALED